MFKQLAFGRFTCAHIAPYIAHIRLIACAYAIRSARFARDATLLSAHFFTHHTKRLKGNAIATAPLHRTECAARAAYSMYHRCDRLWRLDKLNVGECDTH